MTGVPEPVATVFTRRVPAGQRERYEDWLAQIAAATAAFPGSQGTTIVRPADDGGAYLAIAQFASEADMARWLGSAERRRCLDALASLGVHETEAVPLAGMARWLTRPRAAAAPLFKTAVLVFAGLYPLCLVLGTVLNPLMAGWPMPVQLLVSLGISVPLMVWVIMPWLTRIFAAWLIKTG